MPVNANENILRFEVAVHNVERMKVLKYQDHFSGIKPKLIHVVLLHCLEMPKQITTVDIVIYSCCSLGFSACM